MGPIGRLPHRLHGLRNNKDNNYQQSPNTSQITAPALKSQMVDAIEMEAVLHVWFLQTSLGVPERLRAEFLFDTFSITNVCATIGRVARGAQPGSAAQHLPLLSVLPDY